MAEEFGKPSIGFTTSSATMLLCTISKTRTFLPRLGKGGSGGISPVCFLFPTQAVLRAGTIDGATGLLLTVATPVQRRADPQLGQMLRGLPRQPGWA